MAAGFSLSLCSGRHRQTPAGAASELGAGDSYVIAGGIEHAMEVLDGGYVVEVFIPPREDYR